MSRRALIGLALFLCGNTAVADPHSPDIASVVPDRALRLGDSRWVLYRPQACEQKPFDLGYVTNNLRTTSPGIALRFTSVGPMKVDLRIDPLTDRNDLFGPVYDSHIGAASVTFKISF